jgi:hypothetical protein
MWDVPALQLVLDGEWFGGSDQVLTQRPQQFTRYGLLGSRL